MEALLGFLPFLLILLICPLMMFFMHGHGRGHGDGHQNDESIPQPGSRMAPSAGTDTTHDRVGS